ncbi:MAG: 3-hydroxyacyl-CoA dehydrogenase family protein [Deltaproteobacteria bacterium]|uniref:3-hydroxyacyl-CoA dehydrogenase family protein n=1 Tax=Candidatus Zymogenus saltonus TaxID=2844893 RepID=A0A9D8KGI4_9DELT|nr:3-hydroxyacyl-CoA dehydrogenase family protein [Candidatus Zymogenus saltonus]
MTEGIKTVAIIGAGFMGSQIASRASIYGYDVALFDVSADQLKKGEEMTRFFTEGYIDAKGGDLKAVLNRTKFFDDLDKALENADLVIEAVSENVEVKRKVFSQIDEKAPTCAIIATNSSSLPVSKMEGAVVDKRKERVLNIHFASPIPQRNFVELMRGSVTTDEVIDLAVKWSKSIDCIPLLAAKESMGFVVNRVWHSARRDALKMWEDGIADYKDIDRGWIKLTGMQAGIFGAIDYIGVDVVYAIEKAYFEEKGEERFRPPEGLKAMVDRGDLGMKTGKGFYDWPDPEFVKPEFLDPKKCG